MASNTSDAEIGTVGKGVIHIMDFLINFDKDEFQTVEVPKLIIKNFRELGIRPNEWQLISLLCYLESEGKTIPSQDELAEMMGLTERPFKQIIASLKSKGLLEVKRQRKAPTKYNFKPLLDRALQLEQMSS